MTSQDRDPVPHMTTLSITLPPEVEINILFFPEIYLPKITKQFEF